MERLLSDAEKLSGQDYSIDNLGDVYEAIHVIQGDLGLTGVAAEEASQTFSGSFNAMKASAQNLLGSLAIGENVGPAMSQLVTSVSNFFFNNFVPMIGQLIKSLPSAISAFWQTGVPLLVSNLISMFQNLASQITNVANGLTGEKVKAWATTTLPKILSAGGKIVMQLATAFIKNMPKITVAVWKIGATIIKGLGSALWGKVKAAAAGIVSRFLAPIRAMQAKVKAIIEKIKSFFKFKTGTPHIKVPKFSISPAGWKVSDLLKGTIPHLSIKWAAKGGIVDGATLVGAGERGPEAIVPLDPFWKRLDQATAGTNSTNVVININGANKDPREIAEEVKRSLIRETNQRRLAWQ